VCCFQKVPRLKTLLPRKNTFSGKGETSNGPVAPIPKGFPLKNWGKTPFRFTPFGQSHPVVCWET